MILHPSKIWMKQDQPGGLRSVGNPWQNKQGFTSGVLWPRYLLLFIYLLSISQSVKGFDKIQR